MVEEVKGVIGHLTQEHGRESGSSCAGATKVGTNTADVLRNAGGEARRGV